MIGLTVVSSVVNHVDLNKCRGGFTTGIVLGKTILVLCVCVYVCVCAHMTLLFLAGFRCPIHTRPYRRKG